MIARRFGALGWVAGIASAATGLYLVSLQVAAERAKLEDVEARIAATHREMRQLQTELGTRASLRQLEKWNGETLSLTTPRASQFLRAEYQLAALDRHAHDLPVRVAPVVRTATLARVPEPSANPNLARAAYETPPKAKSQVVALGTMSEIARTAKAEGKRQATKRP